MKKKAISVVNDITAGKRNIDKLKVPEFSNKIELFAQKAQTKTVRKKRKTFSFEFDEYFGFKSLKIIVNLPFFASF